MEAVLSNNTLETRKEFVLKKWEQDFADLFSGNHIPANFDEEKDDLERRINQYGYSSNIFLNSDITQEEVRTAIDQAKLKKAVGVEEIPNEVLKSPSLLNVLFCLFKFCFKHSIVPSS